MVRGGGALCGAKVQQQKKWYWCNIKTLMWPEGGRGGLLRELHYYGVCGRARAGPSCVTRRLASQAWPGLGNNPTQAMGKIKTHICQQILILLIIFLSLKLKYEYYGMWLVSLFVGCGRYWTNWAEPACPVLNWKVGKQIWRKSRGCCGGWDIRPRWLTQHGDDTNFQNYLCILVLFVQNLTITSLVLKKYKKYN